ncbi:MAG: hypothetical protein Q9179_004625 [Wetmoreana sp. 5 TL-2023]
MSVHLRNSFMETPSARLSQQWQENINNRSQNGSNTSIDTVQRTSKRQLTPNSTHTVGSASSSPLRVRDVNVHPSGLFNRSNFLSADDASLYPSSIRSSEHMPRKRSWEIVEPIPQHCRPPPAFTLDPGSLEDINLKSQRDILYPDDEDSDKENQEPIGKVPRLSFDIVKEEVLSTESSIPPKDTRPRPLPDVPAALRTSHSFKRWISHLRPQSSKKKKTLTVRTQRWPLDESPIEQNIASGGKVKPRHSGHQKTDSRSSAGFVDAVKAVVMERSAATPVSGKSRRSNPFSRSNRASRASEEQTRTLTEQPQGLISTLDKVAIERATQRQKTLEELVESEAGYVADLKVLLHAYFTFLTLAPNVSQRASTQIHQNVHEILKLHEELLRHMQHVMKDLKTQTDGSQHGAASQSKPHRRGSNEGHRIASAVAGLVHTARTSFDSARPAHSKIQPTIAGTSRATEIAKIFGGMMGRFFVYEEYGAKYELMLRELSVSSKSITNWHAFERSIEALTNSLASSGASEEAVKKGLAFEDLLIKPIQRICKYPLLFEELCNLTLESDSPEAHVELGSVLWRLRQTAEATNRATNDQGTQIKIQRSRRLQDLLILPDFPTLPPSLRLLGHPILCGVLYVAYECKQEVCGDYMLCVLFWSHLLLARQQPDDERYHVAALISLCDSQVGKADEGRASYSWKLVFEHTQHLYEFIFCACSLKEQEAWTGAIVQQAEKATHGRQEERSISVPSYGLLTLNLNSLGPIFGIPGSLTRRVSAQRAATVHSRTNGAQVIIHNTTPGKRNREAPDTVFSSIGRSKSVMSASHVPILAPKRTERSRMESSLADVWTRDRLPFPGMNTHRDHVIRASASSMMRRISRASISSTFSKRSASTTSFSSLKPAASLADLQKIGEGDDERDPRLEAYESLRSTPKADQGNEEKIEGSGKVMRTGTVKGVKLSDATNQVRDREVPRISGQTVRIESTEKGSPRMVRNRRSVPGGLLKGFSPEGLKGWHS